MQIPRLAVLLIALAILTGIAGASYTFWVNPEIQFWKGAAQKKLAWCENMRAKHGYVIGVVGGSSTTFGIDAAWIEKTHALPVANFGLGAGAGADACAGFGLAALKQGDTLIASVEPGLLTDDAETTTAMGTQLAYAFGLPQMVDWDDKRPLHEQAADIFALQPGGRNLVTMAGKLLFRMPLYRYDLKDAQPGGLQVTQDRRPFDQNSKTDQEPAEMTLSHSGRKFLEKLKKTADSRGIKIFYLLPWVYSHPNQASPAREIHSRFLDQVEEILPVLREDNDGIHDLRDDFADTGMHLTAHGARKRSEVLSKLLLKNQQN
jgi:hypothetical protein